MTIDQMREKFEARFPVPEGVVFTPGFGYSAYFADNDTFVNAGNIHDGKWRVWQSAMQQAVPEGILSVEAGFDYQSGGVITPTLKLSFASGADSNELWVLRDKAKAMLAAAPEIK